MGKKKLGVILLVVGLIVLVVALGANLVGIGSPGFGTKQIAGSVLGIVVAAIGAVFMLQK